MNLTSQYIENNTPPLPKLAILMDAVGQEYDRLNQDRDQFNKIVTLELIYGSLYEVLQVVQFDQVTNDLTSGLEERLIVYAADPDAKASVFPRLEHVKKLLPSIKNIDPALVDDTIKEIKELYKSVSDYLQTNLN
tara:strand:- start:119 stop:523 length:405 start_codon:yes stop_codon:yes gene_type:complete